MPSIRQSVELADVVHRFGDRLRAKVALPRQAHRVLNAIVTCRTQALGGQRYACDHCGYEHRVYHSCRNRHCPKCQQPAKAAWLEARRAELLPVPYFHLVFTVPHHFNDLMLANRRLLFSLLFQAASSTLQTFAERHWKGQPGFTAILHTWDQRLNLHVHLHVLIPCGALSDGGRAWNDTDGQFLFPVKALSQVYRGKFLDGLQRLAGQGRLQQADAIRWLIEQSYVHPWIVYAKAPFGSPAMTLSYLGRYTHRVAISNDRILSIHADQVVFNFRNRRQGDRVKTMRLDGISFLRRFLLHVLPNGFVRIRHFGFLGNRVRSANVAKLHRLLADRMQSPCDQARPPSADPREVSGDEQHDRWCQQTCPQCGQPLQIILLPAQKAWRHDDAKHAGDPSTARTRAP